MAYLSGGYDSEDTPNLVVESLFTKYDKDGSETLDREEQMIMLKEDFGMKTEQASNYILLLDKQGKGYLTKDEFIQWIRIKDKEKFKNIDDSSRYYKLAQAVEEFRKYDTDNSGHLDKTEFVEMLTKLVDYQQLNTDDAFKVLDTDGDGSVSFPEFLAWLKWL